MIKYVYIRDKNDRIVFSIASMVDRNASEIYYQFSICNTNDKSIKSIGRDVVTERFENDPTVIFFSGVMKHDIILETILIDMLHSCKFKPRLKRILTNKLIYLWSKKNA